MAVLPHITGVGLTAFGRHDGSTAPGLTASCARYQGSSA